MVDASSPSSDVNPSPTYEPVISPWLWAAFGALVLVLLAIDLAAHRGAHRDSWGAAVFWSAFWIGLAVIFNLGVWHFLGSNAAEEFLAAYLLEKSLSVDNLFVFLVLFQQMRIDATDERKVLGFGVLGALVLRGIFIAAGTALLAQGRIVLDIFGGILLLTAVKLLFDKDDHKRESKLVDFLSKHIPIAKKPVPNKFFVRDNGKLLGTPLLVTLIAVELTDLLFAVDSIPAAFAVTSSPFILYTSNVLALLGLRSLYAVLARGLKGLRYLKPGLALVLALAGLKMILSRFWHVPPILSVAVIAFVLVVCITASLFHRRRMARSR